MSRKERDFRIIPTEGRQLSPTCSKGALDIVSYTRSHLISVIRAGQHEDSAGHKGTIETGGVQWMCAVSPRYLDIQLRATTDVSPVGPRK